MSCRDPVNTSGAGTLIRPMFWRANVRVVVVSKVSLTATEIFGRDIDQGTVAFPSLYTAATL